MIIAYLWFFSKISLCLLPMISLSIAAAEYKDRDIFGEIIHNNATFPFRNSIITGSRESNSLTIDVAAGKIETISAEAKGNWNLIKTGAGQLVMTNLHFGQITIKGGILSLANSRVMGAIILVSGTLKVTPTETLANAVVLTEAAAIDAAASQIFTQSKLISGGTLALSMK